MVDPLPRIPWEVLGVALRQGIFLAHFLPRVPSLGPGNKNTTRSLALPEHS